MRDWISIPFISINSAHAEEPSKAPPAPTGFRRVILDSPSRQEQKAPSPVVNDTTAPVVTITSPNPAASAVSARKASLTDGAPTAQKAPESAKVAKKASKKAALNKKSTAQESTGVPQPQPASPVQPARSVNPAPVPPTPSTNFFYLWVLFFALLALSAGAVFVWRKYRVAKFTKGGEGRREAPHSGWQALRSFLTLWRIDGTGASKSRDSIADRMISDRPLMPDDPDPLGYNDLAETISRFLRNEKTEPPLTLAILGKWGTGKSSIMNLVKADLKSYGYWPVYFNAWHHQNEDYFLAALLEVIGNSGFPPWWSLNGLAFRGRLLRIRLQKDPMTLITVLGLVIVQLLEYLKVTHFSGQAAGMAALAVTAWGFLKGLRTKLNKALKPSSILDVFRIKSFSEKLSFRHRFQKEFSDVTKALNPLKPVIFIDDLDRCKPENVVMILEAVNFLVSSGDCFIFLGMDRDYVLGSVAHQFKDITEDEIFWSSKASDGQPGSAKKERLDFAEKYLEKLINIEIPVPSLEADKKKVGELIMTLVDGKPANRDLAKSRSRRLKYLWSSALVVALFTSMVGINLPALRDIGKPDGGKQVASVAQDAAVGPTAPAPTAAIPVEKFAVSPAEGLAIGLTAFMLFTFALVLSSLTYKRRLKSSGAVTEDSKDFVDALQVWNLLIVEKFKTPRAIKRFLNNVRYLATCTGVRDGDERNAVQHAMTESLLVALSVLHYCCPNGICNKNFEDAKGNTAQSASGGDLFHVINLIRQHNVKFNNLPPDPEVLEVFQLLVSGSRVSFRRADTVDKPAAT